MKKVSKLVYFSEEDTDILNEITKQGGSKGQNRVIKKLIKMGLILQRAGYEMSDTGVLSKILNYDNVQIENNELNTRKKPSYRETQIKLEDELESKRNSEIDQISLSYLK